MRNTLVSAAPVRHGATGTGRRRQAGLTLLEVVLAATLLAAVIGVSVTLLRSSQDLAASSTHQRTAAVRVERTLARMSEELRRGSLATALHLDGTAFGDGESGDGLSIQPVTGWNGSPVLDAPLTYRLESAPGATEGELVRVDGAVQTVLARGITSFAVSRAGSVFTFSVSARSGPADDRQRTFTGTLSVMARNP